jgi:hypothetical protein
MGHCSRFLASGSPGRSSCIAALSMVAPKTRCTGITLSPIVLAEYGAKIEKLGLFKANCMTGVMERIYQTGHGPPTA